jgi:WD40-like Beta Propeller Repeat
MKRLMALAVLVPAALVAASAPAHAHAGAKAAASAGSLVYLKGGNVWVARPDGIRKHRVTRDGRRRPRYDHPSQADNGTIVALRGTYLHRFARGGRRLGKPRRVSAGLAGPGSLHEIAEGPEVSPDGRKVALSKTLLQGTYDPNTGRDGLTILSVTVEYRSASTGKRLRELHSPGDYYQSPSWIGNGRLLVFAPFNSYAPQVFVDTFGGSTEGWFADEHGAEADPFGRQVLDDGELTRAGDRLAMVRGTNVQGDSAGATFEIDSVASLTEVPVPLCTFRPPGSGPFSGPSWSPDGSSIAWSNDAGVWTARLNPSGGDCGATPRLVVRGGRLPDWGPRGA